MMSPNRPALATLLVTLASVLVACGGADGAPSEQDPSVQVHPPFAYVQPGDTTQFGAIVTGSTATAVTWTVQEAGGGTVDASGLYTAPGALGTYHVVATSVAAPSLSASATVTVSDVPSTGIIPDARRTVWNPGVPGGIPNSAAFTVHATLDAATFGNGTSDASAAINSAIASAGAAATAASPRVVQLSAGTFRINGTIRLDENHVILRGAGPNVNGTGGGTRLIETAANTDMFFMGDYADWSAAWNVMGDVPKGASSFTLAAGHGVQQGDLIIIDMLDDSDVTLQGGTWWKRGPGNSDNGPASSGGYRSRGQTCEVTAVSGNVITIRGILHRAYPASRSPQVFRSSSRRGGWVGIGLENMTITGWGDAFGIYANLLSRSWVKRVEFDGRPTSQGGFGTGTRGVDIRVYRSARFTLEGSYLHHSRVYQTNNNAYSVSLAMQTSDSLVWDNTVWFKNKNVVLEASGGGNVVAYNYIEDPVIAQSGDSVQTNWMEMCLDGSHLSHPSFDLFEGNLVAKMGAAETHGNAGDQTFFRNYSKGNRLHPISDSPSVAAVMLNRYMRRMNFVGNVLSVRGVGTNAIYAPTWNGDNVPSGQISAPKIWSLGLDGYDGNWGGPRDPTVEQELIRIANWDAVRAQVDETPSETLPDSLFLPGKPSFFGSNPWPWVNPFGATAADRLKTLPAKARFDAGTFL
jgi:hypothetical protein